MPRCSNVKPLQAHRLPGALYTLLQRCTFLTDSLLVQRPGLSKSCSSRRHRQQKAQEVLCLTAIVHNGNAQQLMACLHLQGNSFSNACTPQLSYVENLCNGNRAVNTTSPSPPTSPSPGESLLDIDLSLH